MSLLARVVVGVGIGAGLLGVAKLIDIAHPTVAETRMSLLMLGYSVLMTGDAMSDYPTMTVQQFQRDWNSLRSTGIIPAMRRRGDLPDEGEMTLRTARALKSAYKYQLFAKAGWQQVLDRELAET